MIKEKNVPIHGNIIIEVEELPTDYDKIERKVYKLTEDTDDYAKGYYVYDFIEEEWVRESFYILELSATSGTVDEAKYNLLVKDLRNYIIYDDNKLTFDHYDDTKYYYKNEGYSCEIIKTTRAFTIEKILPLETFMFKGYVSSTTPTGTIKEGELWYLGTEMPTTFPINVKEYKNGAWSTLVIQYTPAQLDLWADLENDHGYYWFGNKWNLVDVDISYDDATIDKNDSGQLQVKDKGLDASKFKDTIADKGLKKSTDGTTIEHSNSITAETTAKVFSSALDEQGHHTGTQEGFEIQKKGATLADDDAHLLTSGLAKQELDKKVEFFSSSVAMTRTQVKDKFTNYGIILTKFTESESPDATGWSSTQFICTLYKSGQRYSIYAVEINIGGSDTVQGDTYITISANGTTWSAWRKVATSDDLNGKVDKYTADITNGTRTGLVNLVADKSVKIFPYVQFTAAEAPEGNASYVYHLEVYRFNNRYAELIAFTSGGSTFTCRINGGTVGNWETLATLTDLKSKVTMIPNAVDTTYSTRAELVNYLVANGIRSYKFYGTFSTASENPNGLSGASARFIYNIEVVNNTGTTTVGFCRMTAYERNSNKLYTCASTVTNFTNWEEVITQSALDVTQITPHIVTTYSQAGSITVFKFGHTCMVFFNFKCKTGGVPANSILIDNLPPSAGGSGWFYDGAKMGLSVTQNNSTSAKLTCEQALVENVWYRGSLVYPCN